MVGGRTLVAIGCALGVLGAGCSSDDGTEPSVPTTSSAATATSDPTRTPTAVTSGPASTSVSASASSSPTPVLDRLVVPPAAPALPSGWRERFVIGYGRGKALLGTSPGGDSGTLDIGPEYGAPGPDGSWWFLDGAKARLAHYDASGRFVGAVRIPRAMLVGGRYFQWQLPHVLADGTLVATRQTAGATMLLRLRNGLLDEIPVQGRFAATYDDGVRLYGFAGRGRVVAVDPQDGSVERAAYFRTPSGVPFSLSVGDRLELALPDTGIAMRLPLTTGSGAVAHVGIQLRVGADDTFHLFLVGAGEDDESRQLVGYVRVAPDGAVQPAAAMPDPFSEADPGSPAQLAMAPGSSTPMLVYVLDDGVHVFEGPA